MESVDSRLPVFAQQFRHSEIEASRTAAISRAANGELKPDASTLKALDGELWAILDLPRP